MFQTSANPFAKTKRIIIYSLWWTNTIAGLVNSTYLIQIFNRTNDEDIWEICFLVCPSIKISAMILCRDTSFHLSETLISFPETLLRIYSRVFWTISHIFYPCLNSKGRTFCIVNVDERWLNTLHAKTPVTASNIYWMFIYFKAILLSHYLIIFAFWWAFVCCIVLNESY